MFSYDMGNHQPYLSGRASRATLQYFLFGRVPWSSGYGRRLMFQRPWVWIPAPDTGWTWHFSHSFVVKIVLFVWKRPKINEKEAGDGPFFFKKKYFLFRTFLLKQRSCVLSRNHLLLLLWLTAVSDIFNSLIWYLLMDYRCRLLHILSETYHLINLCIAEVLYKSTNCVLNFAWM